jgi:competence protein ComEA
MFKPFRNSMLAAALLVASIPTFTFAAPVAAQKAAKAPVATATADKSSKIDINTATIDQLKAFPGIGDAYSKRIVDGRPFANKGQLLSKGILPAATYNKIKDQIIATQPKGK